MKSVVIYVVDNDIYFVMFYMLYVCFLLFFFVFLYMSICVNVDIIILREWIVKRFWKIWFYGLVNIVKNVL